jgi:restriction system protein
MARKKDDGILGFLLAIYVVAIIALSETLNISYKASFIIVSIIGVLILIGLLLEGREIAKIEAGYEYLSPFEFEKYVAQLFKEKGYVVDVTSKSGDFGADVLAGKGGKTIAIQVKKQRGNIGVKDVNHLIGSLHYYGADKGVLVTTSDFTKPAMEMARKAPIELWDRARLNNEIREVLRNKRMKCPECGEEIKGKLNPEGSTLFRCPKCSWTYL